MLSRCISYSAATKNTSPITNFGSEMDGSQETKIIFKNQALRVLGWVSEGSFGTEGNLKCRRNHQDQGATVMGDGVEVVMISQMGRAGNKELHNKCLRFLP